MVMVGYFLSLFCFCCNRCCVGGGFRCFCGVCG